MVRVWRRWPVISGIVEKSLKKSNDFNVTLKGWSQQIRTLARLRQAGLALLTALAFIVPVVAFPGSSQAIVIVSGLGNKNEIVSAERWLILAPVSARNAKSRVSKNFAKSARRLKSGDQRKRPPTR